MFQISVEHDFPIVMLDDGRRDFSFFVEVLTDLTHHILHRVSPKDEEKRTRRDTATATSRPVGEVQRGFNLYLPSRRALPLVTVRAL